MLKVSTFMRASPVPAGLNSESRLGSLTIADEAVTVESVFAEHSDFLWATLHRMGVREADLPDALQDVLVVVHRRLDSWDGESKITSWLFGICAKVASAHRRRAHVRRETLLEHPAHGHTSSDSPEAAALANDARARLELVLAQMDVERRAVFVMYELEDLSCADIAAELGVPIGTVHSRLHKARGEFKSALARLDAREAHRQRGKS
jgi:RNA polymerase sigma-70 factor (ECF subfamily)